MPKLKANVIARSQSEALVETQGSLAELASVDWSFADARTQDGAHGIHPYPAKFIPQIPRTLLRIFRPPQGTVVLDPFCGSGTTLVEAQAAGVSAIGVDLNPIATLIARVKTRPMVGALGGVAASVTEEARREFSAVPVIPRLDHWFKREVQSALANLVAAISRVSSLAEREALQVALSSIIVRVSNQESDTRYAAIDKGVSAEDVYLLFRRASAQLERALSEQHGGLFAGSGAQVQVVTKDVRALGGDDFSGPVGLVVTSPPYPNAYEYWLYHKYRMYWLGMDPIKVREAEIGARPHYFKKDHHTEADFEAQMTSLFGVLREHLIPGGKACFLVGRSIIHGRRIDNAALLVRAGASHGFQALTQIERPIRRQRKAFNLSHAGISSETLLVFAR